MAFPVTSVVMIVSNRQAPYIRPVTSQLATVGLKPLSSASTPMLSVPPRLGVPFPTPAVEEPVLPLAPPVELALPPDPELPQAASRPPPAPSTAAPPATAAPLDRNRRLLNDSLTIYPPGVQRLVCRPPSG